MGMIIIAPPSTGHILFSTLGLLSSLLPLPYGPEGWLIRTNPQAPLSSDEQLGQANGTPRQEMGGQEENGCSASRACYPSLSGVFSLAPSLLGHCSLPPFPWPASCSRSYGHSLCVPVTPPSLGPLRPLVADFSCIIILCWFS